VRPFRGVAPGIPRHGVGVHCAPELALRAVGVRFAVEAGPRVEGRERPVLGRRRGEGGEPQDQMFDHGDDHLDDEQLSSSMSDLFCLADRQ
jgi:hypothetical protein